MSVWRRLRSFAKRTAPATLIPLKKSQEQTFFAQKLVDDRQRSLVIEAVSFINSDAFNVLRHASLPDAFCN